MPTVQQLIDSIDAQYRNTFTLTKKIEWMDKVQKQIFQLVRHEAPPYTFTTVAGYAFYPLPSDCDPKGVKIVEIETSVGSRKYRELRFINIESTERVGEQEEFYTIQGNENIYINPIPTEETEGRNVYVIYNKRPATLSSVSQIPDLEEDFHELLELGVLVRIARARGEVTDKNNFQADFNMLLRNYMDQFKQVQPEYNVIKNVMPYRRGFATRDKTARVSDLIPGF